MNKVSAYIFLFITSALLISSCKISKHAIRKKAIVDSSALVHKQFLLDSMANQAIVDHYKPIWEPRNDFETHRHIVGDPLAVFIEQGDNQLRVIRAVIFHHQLISAQPQ